MNNIINNWSYDMPTEPGDYLCCWGDVETKHNISFHRLSEHHESGLFDQDTGLRLDDITSCKFARLVYSPTEIKEIEG